MALGPGGAKSKGAAGEREAALLLRGLAKRAGYDVDPARNLEQARGGGYDLNGIAGLGVEVKRVEATNLSGWWKQAVRQADADGTIPVLMHRRNRQPWRFRVRIWAAVYSPDPQGANQAVAIDSDMELAEFEKWFAAYLGVRYDILPSK